MNIWDKLPHDIREYIAKTEYCKFRDRVKKKYELFLVSQENFIIPILNNMNDYISNYFNDNIYIHLNNLHNDINNNIYNHFGINDNYIVNNYTLNII